MRAPMPTPDKINNTSCAVQQKKPKGTFFKPEESFFKKPGEGFFNRSNNTPLGSTDTPFFSPPVQVKTAGDAGNADGIASRSGTPVKTGTPAPPVIEKEEDRQKDKPSDAGKTDPSPDVASADAARTDAAPITGTVAADPTPAVQPAATTSVTAGSAAVSPAIQPETEPQKDKPVPETTAGKTKAAGAVAGDNNTGGATPPSGSAGATSGNTNNASGKTAASITEPAAAQDTPVAKTDTPVDVPAAPASPDQDPGFQQLLSKIKTTAATQKHSPDAPSMSGAIDKAASGGAREVSSRAAKAQVGKISEQEPKPFNEAAFITALLQKIASITPGTLKDADDFKENHRAASLQGDLNRQMAAGKAETQAGIQQTANQVPSQSGLKPKPVHPLTPPVPGPKPVVNAHGGIPKAKTEAEIEKPATAASKELDDAYEKDNITSDQLQASNEAEFKDADDQKNKAQKDIPEAAASYRKSETAALTTMDKHTNTVVKTAIDGMYGSRTKNFKGAQDDQEHGKTENEGKRKEINEALERIYNSTKADVNDTLQKLDNYVKSAFDTETKKAQQLFEDHVDREMTDYKIRRYGTNWMNLVTLGAAGVGTWAHDQMFGMPDYVNTFYQKGKDLYIAHMTKALSGIARVIATVLNAALDRVKKGKQEAEQYVTNLPGDVQKIAKAELKNIKAKFSDLVTTINDKQQSLLEDLAQKYVAKLGELNKQIDELKKANRGLVDALLEAIGKVIKMIRDLTEKLVAVIRKGMKLIGAIIQHPVRFFENMASAVGKGIDKFMSNIMVHLQQGFLSWLMGNLPPGVELPQSMELKDIFKFVMQVLGLTWANLRAKAVDRLGEKIVSKLEKGADKAFEIFELLKNGNLAAIWDYVKDQLSNLKEMAIDTIQNYLIETIATKGIEQIVKLLNPAGAFIAACEAIYGLIKFIIERGQQILDFVNSVIDSIEMILNGSIDGAAAKVEESLKKAIPVTLGFLAGLLNIGGLTQKIQELLEKVRQPVMKVIDWIIEKAVAFAQKAYARLMGKQDKKKLGDDEINEKDGHQPGDTGKTGDEMLDKLLAYRVSINVDGGHTLKFEGDFTSNVLAVYSTRTNLNDLLRQKQEEIYAHKDEAGYNAKQSAIFAINAAKKDFGKALAKYRAKQKQNYSSNVSSEYQQLKSSLDTIGHNLEIIGVNLEKVTLVPTHVLHRTSGNKALNVTAEPLTKIPGNTHGSSPKEAPVGWELIEPSDRSNNWVRAHMLNHQLHGPGVTWNLFPARKTVNAKMESDVESKAKKEIKSDNAYFYEVNLDYSGGDFPITLDIQFGPYDLNNKARGKNIVHESYTLEAPQQLYTVDVNRESAGRLIEVAKSNSVAGMSGFFDKLVKERNKNGLYENIQEVNDRLSTVYANHNDFNEKYRKLVDLIRSRKISITR